MRCWRTPESWAWCHTERLRSWLLSHHQCPGSTGTPRTRPEEKTAIHPAVPKRDYEKNGRCHTEHDCQRCCSCPCPDPRPAKPDNVPQPDTEVTRSRCEPALGVQRREC